MESTDLILRRAKVSRKSGTWQDDDYDVFDGVRGVGRIYLVDRYDGNETWFWGLTFDYQRAGHKCFGRTGSLEEAKAAFRAEYERWQQEGGKPTSSRSAGGA